MSKKNCTKCKPAKNADVEENIKLAVSLINSAMKRHGLSLCDMYGAVNLMADVATKEAILRMRENGYSIRKIARQIHMDDRRVSEIIKSETAKANCGKCGHASKKTCKCTAKRR